MERDEPLNLTKEKIRSILGITPGFLFQFLGTFWIIAPVIVYFDTIVFSFFTYLSMVLMGLCGIICLILSIPNFSGFFRSLREFSELAKLPAEEQKERAEAKLQQVDSQWISGSILPTLLAWSIGIAGVIILILDYNTII